MYRAIDTFVFMKYLLMITCCLCSFVLKAQQMNLDQLKALIYQPVELAADSLAKNEWTLRPELSGQQAHQLYQTYSYGNHKEETGKALAWLRIHADNGKINQLYYQPPGADQYQAMLKEIQAVSTAKKDTEKMENQVVSTYYISAYYTFQTIVGKDSYTVMVTTNNPK